MALRIRRIGFMWLLAVGSFVAALAQPALLSDGREVPTDEAVVAAEVPLVMPHVEEDGHLAQPVQRFSAARPAGTRRDEVAGLAVAPWVPLVRSTPIPTPTLEPEPTPTAEPLVTITGGWARVPVLMYHYIRHAPDPYDRVGVSLSVAPEVFAAQMAFLKAAGYQAVTITDLQRALQGDGGLPPKAVVLTFDDGYADFYEAAWPVLREHGFVSTLFVISGRVGQPGYISQEMLAEMAASGLVEIGSHTVTHPDLTTLSPDRVWHEVVESKRLLEEWTGQPVTSFCYPAGRYHAGVVEAVQAAGYQVAVTTQEGQDHTVDEALEQRRVRVEGPGSVEKLERALNE